MPQQTDILKIVVAFSLKNDDAVSIPLSFRIGFQEEPGFFRDIEVFPSGVAEGLNEVTRLPEEDILISLVDLGPSLDQNQLPRVIVA